MEEIRSGEYKSEDLGSNFSFQQLVSIRIVYPSETCPSGPISWKRLRTVRAQVLPEDGPQRADFRGVAGGYK